MERSWANFDPKMAPSWHQVGFKIEPKRPSKSNWPTIAKTFKSAVMSSKIKGSRCQDKGQVGSKIDPRSNQKQEPTWMAFWKALGANLAPKWRQVGGQVGTKLAPKSIKMESKMTSKKEVEIKRGKSLFGGIMEVRGPPGRGI